MKNILFNVCWILLAIVWVIGAARMAVVYGVWIILPLALCAALAVYDILFKEDAR